MNTTMSGRATGALLLLLGLLLVDSPFNSVHAQSRNQFGPTGATCRGACGPDCPSGCETFPYRECISPIEYRHVTRYTCGVHQSCIDHDQCLDNCAAGGVSQEGSDFLFADCNYSCHLWTHDWAIRQYGVITGTRNTNSWRTGGGPYSGRRTWEYTKSSPDDEERIGRCQECTVCGFDGRCRQAADMECKPCNSCNDVHMRSIDGLRYDYQASGDFILVDSPDGVRVEARQVPYGSGTSVNAGAAIRVDGQVVVVGLEPEPSVRIDGTVVTNLEQVPVALAGGGEVRQNGRAVVVASPSGWSLVVRIYGSYINIAVGHPEAMRGQLSGLLGNADGDPGNDLTARDGTVYPTELDVDQLYDEFGPSWRLSPDESLLAALPWPEGLEKTGSGRPAMIATLASFTAEQLRPATELCLDAGIEEGPLLDACVLDVAATGDPEMVMGAAISAEGVMDALVRHQSATLEAKSEVQSGGSVAVTWTGPGGNPDDYITIAVPGTSGGEYRSYAYVRQGSPLEVRVPDEPGDYELRYIQRQSTSILASRSLTVLPVMATLEAVNEVDSGSQVEVTWTGPDNRDDYLAIAVPGTSGGEYRSYAYVRQGSPLEVRVPDEPGDYELRYIQRQSTSILASRSLTVLPVTATLEAANEVDSGSQVEVTWTGPNNRDDYLAIAVPGTSGGEYRNYTYVRQGSPIEVRVPDEPGNYELRYIQRQSGSILASRSLTVLPVTATLEAANEVDSGSQVEVTWTGPNNRDDYIAIAVPGTSGGEYRSYAYVQQGSPLKVRAPDEPGNYELRYVQRQSGSILASRAIEIRD